MLVPEDRLRQALFTAQSIFGTPICRIRRDICAATFPGTIAGAAPRRPIVATFSVVAANTDIAVADLSGGNAQKIALGRALAAECRVLLLDEPTAGVDIGAKADIRRAVVDLAADGAAVLVAISDFDELLTMCDRVLIVFEGRIIAERRSSDTTEHELMALAGGLLN